MTARIDAGAMPPNHVSATRPLAVITNVIGWDRAPYRSQIESSSPHFRFSENSRSAASVVEPRSLLPATATNST